MITEGMEKADTAGELELKLCPANLKFGSVEEKVSFGKLSIVANDKRMTEGVALDSNELLSGPYVSGYHIAEWLVRNWWRLSYEPSHTEDIDNTSMSWDYAHWMSTIGEGYVWPNIQLSSDGFRVVVESFPSEDPFAKAFRYVGAAKTEIISVQRFHQAVKTLVEAVLHLLDQSSEENSELHQHWSNLNQEIADPAVSFKRRIEALLGCDPEDANPDELKKCIESVAKLGGNAVAELEAHASATGSQVLVASDIENTASKVGFDGRVQDLIRPSLDSSIPQWGTCEAWRVGVAYARAVRRSADLNIHAVHNSMLAQMAGTTLNVIKETTRTFDGFSFAIDDASGLTKIAMRSKSETGRRFDLSRLIADRLFMNDISEPLLAATQSSTYRQKAQRAFAAELLAPIDEVEDFLKDDKSEDRCNEAAQHFNVSPLTISSIHENSHRL